METPVSASSPHWCCVCVLLLYNGPNPQADSDNIDSMSLYFFLCWGLIQQKSRRRQKGETTKGWSKIKGLWLAFFCVVQYMNVFHWTGTHLGHQMGLNSPFHRSPFTSLTGERRATLTASRFKYLCKLILTDRKQEYQGVQGNSGLSYHIKLFPGPLLDSVSSEVLLSEAAFEWSGRRPGVVEMRSGPRTAPPLGATNFPLVGKSERLKVGFDTSNVNDFNDVMQSSGVPLWNSLSTHTLRTRHSSRRGLKKN